MASIQPEYFTFRQMMEIYSFEFLYLHDLIRMGKISPLVFLSEDERQAGGWFSGGYFVGDVDGISKHESYLEYYVGKDINEPNHPENWPLCSKQVYCHGAEGIGHDDYKFSYFSENPGCNDTSQWFYFRPGFEINKCDAESRFRFLPLELTVGIELGLSQASKDIAGEQPTLTHSEGTELASSQADKEIAVVQTRLTHRLASGTRNLSSEIATAHERASGGKDINSIWNELVKMAKEEPPFGCLLRAENGYVFYMDGTSTSKIDKKNLTNRIYRANKKPQLVAK